ncbi:MAG TPA: L,D-transpeptidase family protein, partial [Caulobacteraceae bacterium]|nr:L,D-transpeptidase family protein [Caulobacteraceae bacterium]
LTIIGKAPDDVHEEIGMTQAALAYADALSAGMAKPKEIYSPYTLAQPKVDVAAGLNQAVEKGDVGAWLDGLAPRDAEYQAMSTAYLDLLQRIKTNKVPAIANGASIKPGGRDPRVPAIAQALAAAGFSSSPVNAQNPVYSKGMETGIKGLQAEAGIKGDGVIGDGTIAALNTILTDHAQQIALNMERKRWLARDVPDTRIDVNTAAALLDYYKDGQAVWSSRVVDGQPGKETPQLSAHLFQLVANPPWVVPQGIAEKEVLPKGPGYLAREDMYISDDGQVVQRAGPKSALGRVKFDLDDKYAIYLHDTPSKGPFSTPYRHKSHGCVRVQNAIQFAQLIADQQGKRSAFDQGLASGQTTSIALPEKIPVRLFYQTVFVDRTGKLVYLPDPYGWDAKLADSLGLKAPRRTVYSDQVLIPLGP